jgi:hypothetical protein
MMHNILSSNEISDILNHPIVKSNKASLSNAQKVVRFSFPLSDEMRNKLSNRLSVSLSQTVPMRWVQGDTQSHVDKGEKQFSKTHLIYLTNSVGNLIIDGQTYPIVAGDAHIFNEGLEHGTVHTGNTPRLMIGPMSETGFGVGAPSSNIIYYSNKTDAQSQTNPINSNVSYTLITVDNISVWNIYNNVSGISPSPNGGPYNAGVSLMNTGTYHVYPYTLPPTRALVWGSLFTNNAQVYYKSHSLSAGSGGSGVRNVRHKKRKT